MGSYGKNIVVLVVKHEASGIVWIVSPSSQPNLRFGCVLDGDALEPELRTLARAVEVETGLTIGPVALPSPKELARAIGARQVDFAWVSPTLLLFSKHLTDCIPLVSSVRQGVDAYHSCLFVAPNSSFRSAAGLRGARAAWVAESSSSGYLLPRLALGSHGIDPRGLFKEELFLNTHTAVAQAVLDGRADVGATYAMFENANPAGTLLRAGFLGVDGGDQARVLFVTPEIPADLIVAGAHVDAAHQETIRGAFTRLAAMPTAAQAVAALIGAEDFRAFKPGALDDLKQQVNDGRALGLI